MDEKQRKDYMESLFEAGKVYDGVDNSVRCTAYFGILEKKFDEGLALKQKGNAEGAFVRLLQFVNLGMVTKQHNAYNQKVYEREKRKLERQLPAVMDSLEALKKTCVERRAQKLAQPPEPEPLPPGLHLEPEPEAIASAPPAALVAGPGAPRGAPAPAPAPAPSPSLGPRLIKVFGDGHCMYRSVGAALNPAIAALARNDFGVIIDRDGRDIEHAAALSLRSRVAK